MRFTHSLLALVLLCAPAALAATCDAALFGDGTCDCGCESVDPDCPQGTFKVCQRSHCAAGKVPWEHSPESCMTTACGDGWADPASGEACDDGNAVASGGCGSGCTAVTAGFTCGERAAGCRAVPAQPDAGTPDAGAPSTGAADAGMDEGDDTRPGKTGCASLPGAPLLVAAAAWAYRRRNR
ncbi:MAG: hypothetical protein FJ086_20660 [Deltaproteobacteria bacterium]|nr:hypothetical protein [Deltaproteobacteria bacterium]